MFARLMMSVIWKLALNKLDVNSFLDPNLIYCFRTLDDASLADTTVRNH
jgi:hypothetical protein